MTVMSVCCSVRASCPRSSPVRCALCLRTLPRVRTAAERDRVRGNAVKRFLPAVPGKTRCLYLYKKLVGLPEWPAGRAGCRTHVCGMLGKTRRTCRGPASHSDTATSPIIVNGVAPHHAPLPQKLRTRAIMLFRLGSTRSEGEGTRGQWIRKHQQETFVIGAQRP